MVARVATRRAPVSSLSLGESRTELARVILRACREDADDDSVTRLVAAMMQLKSSFPELHRCTRAVSQAPATNEWLECTLTTVSRAYIGRAGALRHNHPDGPVMILTADSSARLLTCERLPHVSVVCCCLLSVVCCLYLCFNGVIAATASVACDPWR